MRLVLAVGLAALPGAAGFAESIAQGGTTDPQTVSDADHLSARLAAMDHFAASFNQAIAGNRGQILEQSTGYVLLMRPHFKWVVDDPYPQVIVTEGDVLKVYDPDLEQLTLRPLDEALKDTPVSLLTQENVDLGKDFLVLRVPEVGSGDSAETGATADESSTETFVLSPLGTDTLFAEIRLAFSDLGLASLGILDHLGQYTEIRFEAEPDRVIQSADFELEVPPETDVIGG
jgi:outer membrane lipoprotein carrier protein